MPVAANLIALGYLGLFLGVMFKLIVCSLFILSVLMMHNMFLVGVERRSFDFAVLKTMGADRTFVVTNILATSIKYLAFANFLAYPFAYLALQGITSVF